VQRLEISPLLIVIACLLAGCPRVISLDYVPSNSLRGQGQLQVETFEYRAPKKGIERPKEMGGDAQEFEVFYLSQDIGTFFTKALKSELVHSGYEIVPTEKVVVSGKVERFYFDYERSEGQVFEIHVSYTVRHDGTTAYSYACDSTQERSTTLTTSGLAIKAGIKDCIERFIASAQDARAL
jgi:hypothetical protein